MKFVAKCSAFCGFAFKVHYRCLWMFSFKKLSLLKTKQQAGSLTLELFM